MDNDCFLYVLGRFKSLIISSDGEKYSPEGIEEAIVSHSRYIDQIMLYNNQNGYTSALVYPNIDYLKKRCKSNWESIEGKKEAVRRIMNTINDFKNNGSQGGIFPERWLPATFAILDEPFSEKNQMINSTMKMVRPKIEKIYADRIAYMYTPEGKKIDNELNLKSL